MSECWILQKKEQKSPLKTTKPVSSVSSSKAPSSYQPFISNGYLSIQENSPPIEVMQGEFPNRLDEDYTK